MTYGTQDRPGGDDPWREEPQRFDAFGDSGLAAGAPGAGVPGTETYGNETYGNETYGTGSYGDGSYGGGQHGTDSYGGGSYDSGQYDGGVHGNAHGNAAYGAGAADPFAVATVAVPQQRVAPDLAVGPAPASGAGPAMTAPSTAATATEPSATAAASDFAAPPAKSAAAKPGRDRYLDMLRSIALVRVVCYHIFGWAWLTVLFPSMGVMFALAGALMARSLARPAWGVIRGRVRRLLPPMWVFGAFVLALMFIDGWRAGEDDGLWWWIELGNYLVPIGAPPFPWTIGSPSGVLEQTWAIQAAGVLWYLRAYLWFVLLSPVLLWAFRRAPWVTLFAPIALTAVLELVKIPGETGNAVSDFAVYGGCWVLGFAHQEGLLKQVPRYLAVSVSALIMSFGLWWASGHLGPDGWDLNDIPLAQATWSFGFVVILLQYSPSWQELPGKLARFDKLITLSNNRAVTIYLWHNMLIMATVPVLDLFWELPFVTDELSDAFVTTYMLWMFVLVWPLIGLMVLAVGWIEDLAAKRSPRLWPDGSRTRKKAVGGGKR